MGRLACSHLSSLLRLLCPWQRRADVPADAAPCRLRTARDHVRPLILAIPLVGGAIVVTSFTIAVLLKRIPKSGSYIV